MGGVVFEVDSDLERRFVRKPAHLAAPRHRDAGFKRIGVGYAGLGNLVVLVGHVGSVFDRYGFRIRVGSGLGDLRRGDGGVGRDLAAHDGQGEVIGGGRHGDIQPGIFGHVGGGGLEVLHIERDRVPGALELALGL